MWKPPLNFITLHYGYVIALGILGLVVLYPDKNLSAIDSYYFGVSASTSTGLRTDDIKSLKLYQQLWLYFTPTIANLGFINILVVVVRLYWFKKKLKRTTPTLHYTPTDDSEEADLEKNLAGVVRSVVGASNQKTRHAHTADADSISPKSVSSLELDGPKAGTSRLSPQVRHAGQPSNSSNDKSALRIPSPRGSDQGEPIEAADDASNDADDEDDEDVDAIKPAPTQAEQLGLTRRRKWDASDSVALDRAVSSMFVIGGAPDRAYEDRARFRPHPATDIPFLSEGAALGRNSHFLNLTIEDRENLGGIEYRALKLLLKIVVGYFVGLHIFGAICLVGWIQYANPKYTEYLHSQAQGKIWWAFFTSASMVNNAAFTLTPDSMIHFSDATWPMLILSFLGYAGNTFYPVLLRFTLWILYRFSPKNSSLKDPLKFLLDHPRRCYTLLFPSWPTWILFGILFVLNFVDVVLIVCLDLDNPAVNNLSIGPRILASIFQSASARHTGMYTFNLADVNPGVQFSLLVMMYISIFPIAISIRASNTYEERSLGIYGEREEIDGRAERGGGEYVMMHVRNQLSFDLWYMFLGMFCLCCAESRKIMDQSDPAFNVFPIFFEVVSAYGNVGLSLGHPSTQASFSSQFGIFSKLVICAMMIRGRHRGLPYRLDRAIVLPSERGVVGDSQDLRGEEEKKV